jgi:hypothetical protein
VRELLAYSWGAARRPLRRPQGRMRLLTPALSEGRVHLAAAWGLRRET